MAGKTFVGDMAAAREQTDGERIISVVEEVKQLRKEVAWLRAAHEQADRYLSLIERFMSLAEGRHLQNQNMTAKGAEYPPMRDRLLERVEELAKAMAVSDTLKDREDQDGGGP